MMRAVSLLALITTIVGCSAKGLTPGTERGLIAHPQSALLRGGCLEPYEYFELKTGQSLPTTVGGEARVTAFTRSGAPRDAILVYAGRSPCVRRCPENKLDLNLDLYEVYVEKGVSIRGANLCDRQRHQSNFDDACTHDSNQYRGKAVLVDGRIWRDVDEGDTTTLPVEARAGAFTLSCFTGVIAKCAHFGFNPGNSCGDEGRLGSVHQACVLAARADYGRKGHSFTCPQTVVDFYDRLGIHPRETRKPDHPGTGEQWAFEGYWSDLGVMRDQTARFRVRYPACADEVDDDTDPATHGVPDPSANPSTTPPPTGWKIATRVRHNYGRNCCPWNDDRCCGNVQAPNCP